MFFRSFSLIFVSVLIVFYCSRKEKKPKIIKINVLKNVIDNCEHRRQKTKGYKMKMRKKTQNRKTREKKINRKKDKRTQRERELSKKLLDKRKKKSSSWGECQISLVPFFFPSCFFYSFLIFSSEKTNSETVIQRQKEGSKLVKRIT